MEYNNTLALVARMDSIRLVLETAASKRWEVYHMDVDRYMPDPHELHWKEAKRILHYV